MNAFLRSSHLHIESMENMTLLDEMLSNFKYIEGLSDEAGVSVVLVESRLKEE